MAKKKIPDSEYVQAVCPKCEKTHRAHVFWTGKGKARLYCQQCKMTLNTNAYLNSIKVII